jgi:hypothetical protein
MNIEQRSALLREKILLLLATGKIFNVETEESFLIESQKEDPDKVREALAKLIETELVHKVGNSFYELSDKGINAERIRLFTCLSKTLIW